MIEILSNVIPGGTRVKRSKNFKDISGQKFGRLLVLKYFGSTPDGAAVFECSCDCGNRKLVRGQNIVHGKTLSCGCLRSETTRRILATRPNRPDWRTTKTHGHTTGGKCTPEWMAWSAMRNRCMNPSNASYRHYGGRGITVCSDWNYFEKFLKDMGPRPSPKHSLERKNNDLGYGPQNCKWATRKEQCNNTRKVVRLTLRGVTMTKSQWAKKLKISRAALDRRLAKWPVEKSLSLPRFFSSHRILAPPTLRPTNIPIRQFDFWLEDDTNNPNPGVTI